MHIWPILPGKLTLSQRQGPLNSSSASLARHLSSLSASPVSPHAAGRRRQPQSPLALRRLKDQGFKALRWYGEPGEAHAASASASVPTGAGGRASCARVRTGPPGDGGGGYPNPPDAAIPDAATLREQWRFAVRQYSRWYSHAWGTAILAGAAFFGLGWLVKGSNPLPSRAEPHASNAKEEGLPNKVYKAAYKERVPQPCTA
uniref:Uncharacterized protein n=1 Tax=Oryza barthii TaxID=65489 RepID=A0A0D3GHB2_9ORYZ